MKKIFIISVLIGALLTFNHCGKNQSNPVNNCIDVPLIMSVSQDSELGAQVAAQIASDPAQYPMVDSLSKPTAYRILYKMRDQILNSPAVERKTDFKWQLRIIRDDNTQNAFCTPGGYIYIYTGIIKALDNESQLAGVLAHEIAHADLRHSAKAMMNQYGIDVILSIISGGNPSALVQMANQLRGLKNSRCHEQQADESSVNYLSGSNYSCNSAAKFFEKIVAAGGSSTPEIFSTHPDPGNRVENINKKAGAVGCNTNVTTTNDEYALLKSDLGL